MVIDEKYMEKLCNTVAKTILEAFESLSIEDVNMYQLGYKKAIDDFIKNLYVIGEVREFDWEDIYKLRDKMIGKTEC